MKNNINNKILKFINDNPDVLLCAEIEFNEITTRLKQVEGRAFNYVLKMKNEIVYIGYSSNLYYRLVQHKRYGNFDKIALIEYNNQKNARAMERALIKKFKPQKNVLYL